MKGWLALAIALLGSARVFAQADPGEAAVQALENREYSRCVSLVAAAENQNGPSPRLESIRAMAWHESGNAVEAFKSLERYAEMTRGIVALEANSTHRELQQLLQEYRARLEKERKGKEEKLKKERDAEAERIVAAARDAARQKRDAAIQRLDQKLAALPPERIAEITAEDLSTLKTAGQTAFVARFDDRVFRIAQLDTGAFQIGMTRTDFESLVYGRLQEPRPETDEALRAVLNRFRLPRTERVALGVVFSVWKSRFESALSGGGGLEDFAWAAPEFRLGAHQQALLGYVRAASDARATALAQLVPGNPNVMLAEARFDHEDRARELTFTLVLAPETDSAAVMAALTAQFGRPQPIAAAAANGLVRFERGREFLHGGTFAFPAVEGRRLTGRITQSREPGLVTPVFLDLRLTRLGPGDDPQLVPRFDAGVLRPGERLAHSRRLAAIELNALQQGADARLWESDGKRWRLGVPANAFRFDGEMGEQRFTRIDVASGEREEVIYRGIEAEALVEFSTENGAASDRANVRLLRLSRPAQRQTRIGTTAMQAVPFFFADTSASSGRGDLNLDWPLNHVVALGLPAPDRLSAERIQRLIGQLSSGHRAVEYFLDYIQRAEAQGKFIEPVMVSLLYAYSDPAKQLAYLRRAAESGTVHGVRALVQHYSANETRKDAVTITRAEAVRWARRGAELGDEVCTRFAIDHLLHEDFVLVDRLTKQLQARGQGNIDPEDAAKRAARAQKVTQFRAMTHEQRLRAYLPLELTNALGRSLKDLGKERKVVKQREENSAQTGRKVTVYLVENARTGLPQHIWVNRRGVIVGASYFLGSNWRFDHRVHELRQLFGADQLVRPSYNLTDGLREVVGVAANNLKTIEVFRYQTNSYIKVIDHTLE